MTSIKPDKNHSINFYLALNGKFAPVIFVQYFIDFKKFDTGTKVLRELESYDGYYPVFHHSLVRLIVFSDISDAQICSACRLQNV